MERRECCVKNCSNSSHDPVGRKLSKGLTFHCFPAWRTNEGVLIAERTKRRRSAWVAAVGRSDISFDCIPSSMRVCSRHFHSGKPAYEMLDSDPDWVPSLHLGHNASKKSNKKRKGASVQYEAEEDEAKKMAPPRWRDVKSGLQSLLQGKAKVSQEPRDQRQNQTVARKDDTSFRDFFRKALESSLDASIRSRAQSKGGLLSAEYEVQLNLKFPSLDGARVGREAPPRCATCAHMLRRVRYLEQKLTEVSSKIVHAGLEKKASATTQLDQESSSKENTRGGHFLPNEVPPDPEAAPISHDSDSSCSDSTPAPSSTRRPRPRFRKEWLSTFPFLRYSPSNDIMWCHVCRVYGDKLNNRLVKGSNHFTKFSIKKHSESLYHHQNMQRHLWSNGDTSDGPKLS